MAVGLFAFSAVEYAEQANSVVTTLLTIVAALNLLAFFLARYYGPYPGAIINLTDAVVAGLIAWDMFSNGKLYLPYIWLFAAVLYLLATLVAIIMTWRKNAQ